MCQDVHKQQTPHFARDSIKSEEPPQFPVPGDALQDTIGEHLLEVDKAAREREEIILK